MATNTANCTGDVSSTSGSRNDAIIMGTHAEPCDHPLDGFTMLRISLKLPSRLRGNGDGDGLQSLELCFHDDFTPKDGRPISLHFRSADIKWFQTSLVYPTPTPPYYIHELHAIMDLTTPAENDDDDDDNDDNKDDDNKDDDDDVDNNDNNGVVLDWFSWGGTRGEQVVGPCKSLLLGRCPRGPTFICLVTLLLLGLVVWFAVLFLSALLSSSSSSSPLFVFHHNVSTKNMSLALYSQILQLDHLRISSVQRLLPYAAVERNPDFHKTFTLVESLCHDTMFVLVTRLPKRHRDEEVEMVCASMAWHAMSMRFHWRSVGGEMLHDWPNKTLDALKLTYNSIEPGAGTPRVAWVYKCLKESEWVRSCGLCEWDHGVAGWHFACEKGFRALLPGHSASVPVDVAERARDYLNGWADKQSRRRAETMQDPAWDVKGGGFDRHPIESCPEITKHTLGVEDALISVARHMFEMKADFRRFEVVLQKHGLAPGLRRFHPDDWAAAAHSGARPTTPSSPSSSSSSSAPGAAAASAGASTQAEGGGGPMLHRVRKMVQDGLGMGAREGSKSGGGGNGRATMDQRVAAVDSTAVMLFEILDGMDEFERALAQASVGVVGACEVGNELWKYLGLLNKGLEPVSWDVGVEDAGSPAGEEEAYTVTLQVSQTRYTVDAAEEATKLADGVADLLSAFPPRPTRMPGVVFAEERGDVDIEEWVRQHAWVRQMMDFSYAASKAAREGDMNKTVETREGTLMPTHRDEL